ncbi:MAG: hypothetical protein ACT4PT_09275 [Methanobacteriota archaeon]
MVSFEVVQGEYKDFEPNNFLEVARKKAVGDNGRTSTFLSISRGYYTKEGEKRWKASITIPDDPEMVAFILKSLQSL